MDAAIAAAVTYLSSHISSSSSSAQVAFESALTRLLNDKYATHWHSDDPERGSAFRCITRTGAALDAILVQALQQAQLDVHAAAASLRTSMAGADKWTLWIDPGCVSIRMHNGSSAGSFTGESPSVLAGGKAHLSGIVEVWGKLPISVTGELAEQGGPRRPKTPFGGKTAGAVADDASLLAAELEALASNASPARRNKAIAIVRPDSAAAHASPLSLPSHKALASITSAATAGPVATPPRPLCPLSFTIQESTSPYVPCFSAAKLGTAAPSGLKVASAASSNGSTTRSPTPTLPMPIALRAAASSGTTSPPMYSSESLTSCSSSSSSSCSSTSASDPFARPESRSSTTSVGSNISCSIFSHTSSESRSSSITSFASSAQPTSTVIAAKDGMKIKATAGEKDAVKGFTFPNTASSAAFKMDTLSVAGPNSLGSASAPCSPSKPRRHASRHGHTLSTSSVASVASATSSSAGSTNGDSKGHSRGRASRSDIRVVTTGGTVTDYSNGKVGVLGGGVMLGTGASKKKDTASESGHRRAASSTGSLQVSDKSAASATTRPRSKSRTPSSGSATSDNGFGSAAAAHYSHQFHAHPQGHNYYAPQQQQHNQFASAQAYWQQQQHGRAYNARTPPVPMLPAQYAGQGY